MNLTPWSQATSVALRPADEVLVGGDPGVAVELAAGGERDQVAALLVVDQQHQVARGQGSPLMDSASGGSRRPAVSSATSSGGVDLAGGSCAGSGLVSRWVGCRRRSWALVPRGAECTGRVPGAVARAARRQNATRRWGGRSAALAGPESPSSASLRGESARRPGEEPVVEVVLRPRRRRLDLVQRLLVPRGACCRRPSGTPRRCSRCPRITQ